MDDKEHRPAPGHSRQMDLAKGQRLPDAADFAPQIEGLTPLRKAIVRYRRDKAFGKALEEASALYADSRLQIFRSKLNDMMVSEKKQDALEHHRFNEELNRELDALSKETELELKQDLREASRDVYIEYNDGADEIERDATSGLYNEKQKDRELQRNEKWLDDALERLQQRASRRIREMEERAETIFSRYKT